MKVATAVLLERRRPLRHDRHGQATVWRGVVDETRQRRNRLAGGAARIEKPSAIEVIAVYRNRVTAKRVFHEAGRAAA